MTVAEILHNDSWSVAEGEENGKPLFIRFRDEFATRPDVSGYPRLIRIVWKYEADENGLPTLDIVPRLKTFESLLTEAVQPTRIGVLVAAITHDGTREWMFYASGVAAFQAALNEIQEGADLYPIDVSSARDPQWSAFYDDILDLM